MKHLKIILRIVISAGLLFFIFRRMDFKEMLELLRNAHLGIFLTSFGGYALVVLVSALRWHRLLEVQDIRIPYRRTLAYYIIGFFYNNFLPAVVGGGFVRAFYAGRVTQKSKGAFSSMLVELVIGVWGLVIFALLISLFWFKSPAIKKALIPLLGAFILLTVLMYLFFERGFMRKFKGLVERIKVFNLGSRMSEFYNALYIYKDKKRAIFESVLLSFGVQFAIGLMNISIGIALGFKLPLVSYIIYPSIISLLMILPITINGLGLREWGYRFFFIQVGLTGSQAVTLSLLFYFVGVIGSLVGGIIFPFMKLGSPEQVNIGEKDLGNSE